MNWLKRDGPREKLLKHGSKALTDQEILAIFLRTGTRKKGVMALSRELIETFGGLRGLLQADQAEILTVNGIGEATYVQLKAALEMTERYIETGLQRGDALSDPIMTRRYLKSKLRNYDREVFACLYLDNQHRLIRYQELFFGTIDGASVHPREVVKSVLVENAAAVIFAHNHPSGIAEPSQADERITRHLKSALALIDVWVLDHMIVGDKEVVSFAERGLL